MKLKITIRGDKEILSKLNRRIKNLKDFSQELNEVGKYLVKFFQNDVFDLEGQPIGENWANIQPAYEEKKRSQFPGAGILTASGKLRKSFKYSATSRRMVFQNTLKKYGPTHQFGDKSRGIPKRTFFKIDEARQKKIVDIINKGFERRIAV